jgi:hypothetical protein
MCLLCFREDTGRFPRWKMAKHRQDLEVSGDFWAKEVDFFSQNRRLNERLRREENCLDIQL